MRCPGERSHAIRAAFSAALALHALGMAEAAFAETPWEAYLRAPSSAGAAAVTVAEYTEPDLQHRRLEADLALLEYEVTAGEPESTRLAVRLRNQHSRSAAIAEYLDAILGRAIRPNPLAYLNAIAGTAGCPGVKPSGDLFADRDDARAAELRARVAALKAVGDRDLRRKRDECVRQLETT